MLLDRLRQRLLDRKAAGLLRQRVTGLGPSDRVAHRDSGAVLNFASNDYLGLANHPTVLKAFHEGLDRYGAGAGASAMVSGHSLAHEQLEHALADWVAPLFPECQCLLFSTGYLANLALLTAITERGDALFCDKLNHASLIDGMRLSEADHRRFPHRDMEALERLLASSQARIKMIVTDGVFSMDGDLAPLQALLNLAERFDATVIVDDAHAMGVLGEEGRGTMALSKICSERFILMGTLGKAAGVSGAFVAAHPLVIEWMQQAARSFIYTTAPPPAISHALLQSVEIIRGDEGSSRRNHLTTLIRHMQSHRSALNTIGLQLPESITPIQPVLIGDNVAAMQCSMALACAGFWVPAIRPPTVPEGTARLRVSLSAAHTIEDVSYLCSALTAPRD
ncbi:MAG: hypothetical protein RL133_1227 [Pseudomonadota bacterium]